MKRKPEDPFREALNSLVRAQALLVEGQAERDRETARIRREMVEIDRRIEERVNRIEAILLRLIEVIPDALRERIGIQPKPQT